MARVSLACYTIRIKERRSNDYYLVEDVEGESLIVLLDHFFNSLSNRPIVYENDQKAIRCKQYDFNNNYLNGLVTTGEYGYENELVNIVNNTPSYTRDIEDAEFYPFYFLTEIVPGYDEAIILMQRFGQLGFRTLFSKSLKNYFKENYPNCTLELKPLVPRQLLNEYVDNGTIKKFRFIRHNLPRDIADRLEEDGVRDEDGYAEYVIGVKRNVDGIPMKERLQSFFNNDLRIREFIELENFEYDSVKVELKLRSKTRTINLGDPDSLRSYIDITDEIEIGINGHPEFESIDEEAKEVLADLMEGLRRIN
jgi:hypothetical protein